MKIYITKGDSGLAPYSKDNLDREIRFFKNNVESVVNLFVSKYIKANLFNEENYHKLFIINDILEVLRRELNKDNLYGAKLPFRKEKDIIIPFLSCEIKDIHDYYTAYINYLNKTDSNEYSIEELKKEIAIYLLQK